MIDLHSRRLIGWSLPDHARADLGADALTAAVACGGNVVTESSFAARRSGDSGLR